MWLILHHLAPPLSSLVLPCYPAVMIQATSPTRWKTRLYCSFGLGLASQPPTFPIEIGHPLRHCFRQKSTLIRRPATIAVSIAFRFRPMIGALFLPASINCRSGVTCNHGVTAML